MNSNFRPQYVPRNFVIYKLPTENTLHHVISDLQNKYYIYLRFWMRNRSNPNHFDLYLHVADLTPLPNLIQPFQMTCLVFNPSNGGTYPYTYTIQPIVNDYYQSMYQAYERDYYERMHRALTPVQIDYNNPVPPPSYDNTPRIEELSPTAVPFQPMSQETNFRPITPSGVNPNSMPYTPIAERTPTQPPAPPAPAPAPAVEPVSPPKPPTQVVPKALPPTPSPRSEKAPSVSSERGQPKNYKVTKPIADTPSLPAPVNTNSNHKYVSREKKEWFLDMVQLRTTALMLKENTYGQNFYNTHYAQYAECVEKTNEEYGNLLDIDNLNLLALMIQRSSNSNTKNFSDGVLSNMR